ncbi:MAG: TetR family transcriptional regulator [Alphaproteobacteria bacterium]
MAKRATRKSVPDPKDAIVDAALRLAASRGWCAPSLADIAAEAGIEPAELHKHFRHKSQILCAFCARIDQQMLDGTDPDIGEEPIKDRLFDVIMRRLDALRPHKDAIRALARETLRTPPAALALAAGPLRNSLQWMLAAAKVEPWGPLQPLQVKGLGLVYLSVMRVWLDDDGEDQAKTMAALDKALARAGSLAGRFRPRRKTEAGETSNA